MAELALPLYVLFLVVAFGLRSLLMRRRAGTSGFHGISGDRGSLEWLAGVAFVAALVLGLLAPALAATHLVDPVAALDGVVGHGVGIALTAIGIVLTLAAQVAMGASWRIGVDEEERTQLVMTGPFAIVRNPFFAGLLPTGLGLALLAPNWVALLGLVTLLAAVELQVRLVEEPYLRRTHGTTFLRYASQVGRFFPSTGRLGG